MKFPLTRKFPLSTSTSRFAGFAHMFRSEIVPTRRYGANVSPPSADVTMPNSRASLSDSVEHPTINVPSLRTTMLAAPVLGLDGRPISMMRSWRSDAHVGTPGLNVRPSSVERYTFHVCDWCVTVAMYTRPRYRWET